ncbi:MAG: RIP metalloprotease RseP [Puniceicoccales bacterium]|jgi:RIP metalloprotease RseP|nr:RIP metalloprotease RseP [Puniceicoccales bacterium]
MEWGAWLLNLWAIFWMLAFFGGSIFIHEFGHFLIAKKRKLYVPTFSIGFGPKIFSWKRGETEYCISLFPLGGYVALPQMGEIPILEGSSTIPTKTLSFTDKFLVAVMGAVFNILFAFVIATMLWIVGLSVPEQDKSTEIGYIVPKWSDEFGVTQPSPALQAGLQVGDKILAIDDQPIQCFSDIEKYIILGTHRSKQGHAQSRITFERNRQTHSTVLRPLKVQTNLLTNDFVRFSGIIAPKQDLTIERIESGSSAEKIGLQLGDKIVAIDDQPLHSFLGLRTYLNEKKPESVALSLQRNGELLKLACEPLKVPQQKSWLQMGEKNKLLEFYVDEQDRDTCIKILTSQGEFFIPFTEDAIVRSCNGIRVNNLNDLYALLESFRGKNLMFELVHNGKSQLVSLPATDLNLQLHDMQYTYRLGILFQQKMILTHPTPWKQFSQSIQSTLETFSRLVNKNSDIKVQHLMGAPGIMRLLHRFSTDDFRRLLWFIVLLNINLAILNLFPIPVLDGGHILFACIEKIRGKALPGRLISTIQTVFVILFLGLMLYVTVFDLRRWQGDLQMESEQKRLEKLAIPIQLN